MHWNRNFTFLALAAFGLNFGFGIYFSGFNPFIVEEIGVKPYQLGYIEALREVPGLLNAFYAAFMMYIAAPLVGGFSLVVMGLGLGTYSQVSTVLGVIVCSEIWSLGFHCWLPLQSSMALAFSEGPNKGKWLGQLKTVEGMATLSGAGLFFIVANQTTYQTMFVVAGVAIAMGGIAIFQASKASKNLEAKKQSRFLIKRDYWLYYVLTFLQGCRKQIFITFAIFVLVREYHISRQTVAALFFINTLVALFAAPLIGMAIDRFGERKLLSISYFVLIFVLIGYGIFKNVKALYLLYCLDNLFFIGAIALTTYLNKIALPEDIRPTLSMGVTTNHIAAVITPLVGGTVWQALGRYDVVFYAAAVVAVMSLIMTQFIRVKTERKILM